MLEDPSMMIILSMAVVMEEMKTMAKTRTAVMRNINRAGRREERVHLTPIPLPLFLPIYSLSPSLFMKHSFTQDTGSICL